MLPWACQLLLLLWACRPDTAAPPHSAPDASLEQVPDHLPAQDQLSNDRARNGSGSYSSRAAPAPGTAWKGTWTASFYTTVPDDPASRAMASALGLETLPYNGRRPDTGPGDAAILWLEAGSDLDLTSQALAPRGRAPQGDVLVVLGCGDRPWSQRAAQELPWAGVGIVDPIASLSLWINPAAANDSPWLSGLMAAWTVAEHYDLPYHPSRLPMPPGLAQLLGPANPQDTASESPRVRATATLRFPSRASPQDPETAVRIALARSTGDQGLLARLATDTEPLVRARAASRLDNAKVLASLTGDPSSVVRVMAADRVANLIARGSRDPVLLAAARNTAASPDAYLRWKAAYALGWLGDDVLPSLLALLGDPDIDVQREAARSLGRLGNEAAVKDLLKALESPNSFVRRWSAQALGEISDESAMGALEQLRNDPTLLVARAACFALQRLGVAAPAPEYNPPRPPEDLAAATALARSPDATDRKDSAKYLVSPATPERLALLVELASDPDSEVRKTAVEAMAWYEISPQALVEALNDGDPDVVVTALETITELAHGKAQELVLSPVIHLLSHPDSEIRLRAAEALAAMGASDVLRPYSHDPDERIRAAVASLLPGNVAPDEASILVKRAAASAAPGLWDQYPDSMIRAVLPAARHGDDWYWARGVIAGEDDLLHQVLSWNDPSDVPHTHETLRPPVIRSYGHPDRG